TEFNINDEFGKGDTLPENKGTWGNGLGNVFCVHYWLANEPRVKVALLHELARVIDGDGPNIHAHGRAYSLFAQALTGRTRARSLTLARVPPLAGSGGNIPGVIGWAFNSPGKAAAYVVVNFSDTRQTLTGLRLLPGAKRYTQASAPLKAITDPGETTGTLPQNALPLPPYSVTIIESARSKS
nr:hypothetical protein [Armatimonadota bacterium]